MYQNTTITIKQEDGQEAVVTLKFTDDELKLEVIFKPDLIKTERTMRSFLAGEILEVITEAIK